VADNPPEGFPRVTPYLFYEDTDGALEFIVRAFGFTERYRMRGPDGRSIHAEAELGDGVVMMGTPGPEYRNPVRLGGPTAMTYVYVDDVDAHHAGAKMAGAQIVTELADQTYGDRNYTAKDPEGQLWTFAQRIRDVSPEDGHP